MEVTRIIHPIGQGAFYSEVLRCTESNRTFTVVYDCGCGNTNDCPKSLFDYLQSCELFEKRKEIEILFISHFHNDHINGIKTLIDKGIKIRNIVMPYVKPTLLASMEPLRNEFDGTVFEFHIQNPYKMLHSITGGETRFIYVVSDPIGFNGPFLPANSQEKNPFGERRSVVDITNNVQSDDNKCYYRSGDVMSICDWFFLPFVDDRRKGDSDLEDAINKLNELVPELKIIYGKDWLIKGKTQITDAYRKINKNLNQTSLMVFSSPVENNRVNSCDVNHECLKYHSHNYRFWPSCLYTGDISLSKSICKQIEKNLAPYQIGTLQLPHHGAKNGWIVNKTTINNKLGKSINFYSHGISNTYHHPHKEVYMYFANNKEIFHGVNEACNSILIQKINLI